MKAALLTLAFALCGLGWAWVALAMDTHWAQALPRRAHHAAQARLLRVLGAASLLAALAACLQADHASMAALVWVMALTTGALLVALLLAWRPRWLACSVAWLPVQHDDGPARVQG